MNKNSMLTAVIAASTLVGITSCNKDKKFENRIDGEWEVSSLTLNGTKIENLVQDEVERVDIELEFDEDGDFTLCIKYLASYNGQPYGDSYRYTGDWSIDDGELTIDSDNARSFAYSMIKYHTYEEVNLFSTETYNIEKLKGDDLTLEGAFGGVSIKIEAIRD